MRVVASLLLLSMAALSGCVSLVEDGGGSDQELDNALADAHHAYDDYQAQAGHISGTVLDGEGAAVPGAIVDLVGLQEDLAADDKGRFAFLDLAPGLYMVSAEAPGFLAASTSVEVQAGQFARPDLVLAAAAPAPYYTMFHFEAYQQASLFGFSAGCMCDFEGDMDAEGLTQVVLEAQLGDASNPVTRADGFRWFLESWNETDGAAYAQDSASSYDNEDAAPLHVILEAEDFAPGAVRWLLNIEPTSSLQVTAEQVFDGFLTFFYNGPAPDGYSAYALEA